DAALVTIHRDEVAGDGEDGDGFLGGPPGIFAAGAVVVVAVADPIEVGGVDGVAPHVEQAAIVSAVGGELGVAVEFAAPDAQRFVAEGEAIVVHGGDGVALGGNVGDGGNGLGRFGGTERDLFRFRGEISSIHCCD